MNLKISRRRLIGWPLNELASQRVGLYGPRKSGSRNLRSHAFRALKKATPRTWLGTLKTLSASVNSSNDPLLSGSMELPLACETGLRNRSVQAASSIRESL